MNNLFGDEIIIKIQDKDFTTTLNGYNPIEVDNFLDLIVKGLIEIKESFEIQQKEIYELNTNITKLKSKNSILERENKRLKQENKSKIKAENENV